MLRLFYTYAEELYPWIVCQEPPNKADLLNTFITLFGEHSEANTLKGDFRRCGRHEIEAVSKTPRILALSLYTGQQIQINRVERRDESSFLTKVDALNVLPYSQCSVLSLFWSLLTLTIVYLSHLILMDKLVPLGNIFRLLRRSFLQLNLDSKPQMSQMFQCPPASEMTPPSTPLTGLVATRSCTWDCPLHCQLCTSPFYSSTYWISIFTEQQPVHRTS